jgi:hypothetical protein
MLAALPFPVFVSEANEGSSEHCSDGRSRNETRSRPSIIDFSDEKYSRAYRSSSGTNVVSSGFLPT